MSPPDEGKPGRRAPKDDRETRLAERLRANLQRRKAQARSRREGGADSRPEGLLKGKTDDSDGDR